MLKSLIFSPADLWGFLTKPHFCQFMTETHGPARRRTLFETLSGFVNSDDDDHGKMDAFTPVPYEAVFRQDYSLLDLPLRGSWNLTVFYWGLLWMIPLSINLRPT